MRKLPEEFGEVAFAEASAVSTLGTEDEMMKSWGWRIIWESAYRWHDPSLSADAGEQCHYGNVTANWQEIMIIAEERPDGIARCWAVGYVGAEQITETPVLEPPSVGRTVRRVSGSGRTYSPVFLERYHLCCGGTTWNERADDWHTVKRDDRRGGTDIGEYGPSCSCRYRRVWSMDLDLLETAAV